MAGSSARHDKRIDEVVEENQKLSYFFKGGKCVGVAAVNCSVLLLKLKIALAKGAIPDFDEFLTEKTNSLIIANSIKVCRNCSL